ncbi:right-handed parallel beta-helix repeat-containing protein [Hymenobacter weizhouensis]|uniref:right-handed parallel beta-helix repeat-containing protein n=1 Tax=Hymenobacter sp. YIM 151500-1 TaxID=2987689 RepID=UPI0022276652|nr:right-handed parallel beta-helix repeat-containing protein [Hymenobacter sp. YIM 151500-1]UYZ64750.1 right-handed parallel beta-helix repeat-containing protein [Hymenobacter sp. YIM 151500-1]
MKKLLFTLLTLMQGVQVLAATYYFAANGDDARTGAQAQNAATPWQSLTKLNAVMSQLQPGDQVLFRRGDVFRGALTITRSGNSGAPLTFGAYGTGVAPVLSGAAPLSGWTSVGTNLWEASCASCGPTVTSVVAGGRALPLGRYPNLSAPNKGYLTVDSHASATQFSSAQLSGAAGTNWSGGEAVLRTERWILDRAAITAQSGTTLTLAAAPVYGLKDRWGFFIQNHPATLDQAGEWYYNAATRKIRLYSPSSPAAGAVEATVAPVVVRIHNQRFITLENLTIAHGLNFNLDAETVSGFMLRGVAVVGAGEDAVRLNGIGADVLLENCLINHTNNNALSVSGYTNVTLRGNTLQNTGLVAGRGKSGDGQYFTLNVGSSTNALLENNTLDSCGYVGLSYYFTDNITIRNNVIRNFAMTKDDGGGIYTWNGGSPPRTNLNARILGNLVLNAVGAPEGTDNLSYIPGHGIYLDDCTMNVEVGSNTVAYCRSSGIFLHGTTSINVHDNTCIDNSTQLLLAPAGSCGFSGLQVRSNILFSSLPGNRVAWYETSTNNLATLGTFGGNYYARPFDDLLKVGTSYRTAPNGPNTGPHINRTYTLAEWQAAFGQDAGSHNSPVTFRPFRVDARTGPNLLSNGEFGSNSAGWSGYSSAGNGQLTWDNTNRLGSGGSLRLAFGTASGQADAILTAETRIGSVQQAKRYAVRFEAACSAGSRIVEVYLKRGAGSYADLTPRTRVQLTPAKQQVEVALVPTADDPTANLAFTVVENPQQVWLDNVAVQEATLTAASIADSIRFEYNATAAPRTVSLPAGARYVDVRNAAYSGSLTLAPYSSVVLLRQHAAGTVTGTSRPAAQGAALEVFPNPAAHTAAVRYEAAAAGPVRLELLDALGRVVLTRTATVRAGANELPLDLGLVAAGYHVLRLTPAAGASRFGALLVGQER